MLTQEQFLEKMGDLCQTLQAFQKIGASMQGFRTDALNSQTPSSIPLEARLAEEYIGLGKSKQALTVIKNLLFLGLAIGIMLKVR